MQPTGFQPSGFQPGPLAVTIAGVATVSGVGEATAAAVGGASDGVATVAGVGEEVGGGVESGVGSAAGAATVTGVGEDATPAVDDDGSNVWQRRKRANRNAIVTAPENYDRWREAAARELQELEYNEEAIALLLMAA
jgi:hypothetical protein